MRLSHVMVCVACVAAAGCPKPPPTSETVAGQAEGRIVMAVPGTSLTRPVEGALIRAVRSTVTTRSDAQGHFRLPVMPSHTQLLVTHVAGELQLSAQVDAGDAAARLGGTTRVGDILLLANGAVRGRVLLENPPTSLASSLVVVPGFPAAVATNNTGDYVLDNLPAGALGLLAVREGYVPQDFGSQVQPGQLVTLLDRTLAVERVPPLPGALTGTVVLLGRAGAAGVVVRALTLSGQTHEMTTAEDGRVALMDLPQSLVEVRFIHPDFSALALPNILIPGGETLDLGDILLGGGEALNPGGSSSSSGASSQGTTSLASSGAQGSSSGGNVSSGGGTSSASASGASQGSSGAGQSSSGGGASSSGAATGDVCTLPQQCQSGICTPQGTCAAPACNDLVHNGEETDRDCGGPTCLACAPGARCALDRDCSGTVCEGGLCQAVHTLTVVLPDGGALGGVEDDTGALACRPVCRARYVSGTSVTVRSLQGPAAPFEGFQGDCSGVDGGVCTLTMDADRTLQPRWGGPSQPTARWVRPLSTQGETLNRGLFSAPTTLGFSAVTGTFTGTQQYGLGTLTAADTYDVYVLLTDGMGMTLAQRRLSGPGDQVATDVVALPNGDVVVVLTTGAGMVDLGNTSSLVDCGEGALAFARLSGVDLGSQWAVCHGTGITPAETLVDGATLVVAGSFTGTVDFGGTQRTAQGADAFVARYAAMDGTLLDVATFGEAGDQAALALALAQDGTLVVAGSTTGALSLGGQATTAHGGMDAFVARLTAELEVVWGRRMGGTRDDDARAVAFTAAGDVVVAGMFHDSMEVLAAPAPPLQAASTFDAWYAVLALNQGTGRWARRFGPPATFLPNYASAQAERVVRLPNGLLMLGIAFKAPGSWDFLGTPLVTTGSNDVLFLLVSERGTVVRAHQMGYSYNEKLARMTSRGDGYVLVSGYGNMLGSSNQDVVFDLLP